MASSWLRRQTTEQRARARRCKQQEDELLLQRLWYTSPELRSDKRSQQCNRQQCSGDHQDGTLGVVPGAAEGHNARDAADQNDNSNGRSKPVDVGKLSR